MFEHQLPHSNDVIVEQFSKEIVAVKISRIRRIYEVCDKKRQYSPLRYCFMRCVN